MRKSFFLLMIACLTIVSAQAQFRFGAKVGISTNFIGGDVMQYMTNDNTIGFYAGPSAEFRFGDKMGVDGSVLYSQKTVEFTGQGSHHLGYIQVPLNFKYFFNLHDNTSVFLAVGPYVGFKVAGDDTFTVNITDYTGQWNARKTNVGGNFTLGGEFFERFQVSITYAIGTSDELVENNLASSAKERQLSFAVACYF